MHFGRRSPRTCFMHYKKNGVKMEEIKAGSSLTCDTWVLELPLAKMLSAVNLNLCGLVKSWTREVHLPPQFY